MTDRDLLLPSIIAMLCFAFFAVSIALIVYLINFLILTIRSLASPNTSSPDFYSQVKDLMLGDLVPSTSLSSTPLHRTELFDHESAANAALDKVQDDYHPKADELHIISIYSLFHS